MTEGAFFQDLAILMAIAGFVSVVFARLGWPKVIGYIAAGILLNDYTWGGSFLVDVASIRTIGQLGVVFLMFGMGLSFSSGELKKIKSVVMPCAVVDTIVMIWLGYTVGTRILGWGAVPALFLGVAICDSATTLLAKVIDEMNWGSRPFAKYVLGTSVCEDIICVGAIALATGFATGGSMSLGTVFKSLSGLSLFFLVVIVFGMILIPRLFASVAKRNDDESLLLATLGCCFFISYFAFKFNYSLALGAFLVGIIAASGEAKFRIARLAGPLKSMFAAVFFVTIGLLVDPFQLVRFAPQILLISSIVVIGKFLTNTTVSLLTGLDVKTSIQNGFSLAQIGEFSFMVAILYMGLPNAFATPLFPIAVGASLLTTLLNPTMIRLSGRVGDWAEQKLPVPAAHALEAYRGWLAKIGRSKGNPAFQRLRNNALLLALYAALAFSVSVICALLHSYDYSRFSLFLQRNSALIFFALSNFFILALLPLVLAASRHVGAALAELLLGRVDAAWLQPVVQFVRLIAVTAALGLYGLEWLMIAASFTPKGNYSWAIVLAVIVLVGILGWRFLTHAVFRATIRLKESLNAEKRLAELGQMMTVQIPENTVHKFKLDAHSPAVGETVVTLNIRAKTGASVVAVRRNGRLHRNIGPEWEFQSGDEIVALGDGVQTAALKDILAITA